MSTHCQGQWTCEDLPFIIFIPLSKNKTKITANTIKALTASEFILHKGMWFAQCDIVIYTQLGVSHSGSMHFTSLSKL